MGGGDVASLRSPPSFSVNGSQFLLIESLRTQVFVLPLSPLPILRSHGWGASPDGRPKAVVSRTKASWSVPHQQTDSEAVKINISPQSHSTTTHSGHQMYALP